MLMRRPRHKSFDYVPRYYDPEKDEVRKKVNFHRKSSVRLKKNNLVRNLMIFVVVLLTFLYLIGKI